MSTNRIKENQEISRTFIPRTQRRLSLWEIALNQLSTEANDLSEEVGESISSTIIND
jgi:hypothetical protein